MREISGYELMNLSFGNRIRIAWIGEEEEWEGIIFGNKIGYYDGFVDTKKNIYHAMCDGECGGLFDVMKHTI